MATIEIPESVATCPNGGPLVFDADWCQFLDEDGDPVPSLVLAQNKMLVRVMEYVKANLPQSKGDSNRE